MGVADRRKREKEERRETILLAATRVFLARGLSAATMEQIAREAELSKGALYLYFRSKDELFLSIALAALHEIRAGIQEVAEAEFAVGMDRVRRMVETYVGFALAYPNRFRVAMSWLNSSYEIDDSSPLFAEYQGEIQRIFGFGTAALSAARADGSMRAPGDPAQMMMQVWGSTVGMVLLESSKAEVERRVGARVAVSGVTKSFIDLVIAGLRAAPPQIQESPSDSTVNAPVLGMRVG